MNILRWPNEALATKCEKVIEFGPELAQQLDEMWKTLEAVENGMALAANQVGIMKRMFIMKDLQENKHEMINPMWSKEIASGIANEDEGCLSTPGLFDVVPGRFQTILVMAQDRKGELVELEVEGLISVCVQHEVDHLDGVFWFDRMNRNQRRKLIREWRK